MTELSVNYIRGERGAACINDAFAIVTDDGRVVDILTVAERAGRPAFALIGAFSNAITHHGLSHLDRVRANARQLLGIAPV